MNTSGCRAGVRWNKKTVFAMTAKARLESDLKTIGPMVRISSKVTRYYKFLLPVLWLGLLIVVGTGGLYMFVQVGQEPPPTVYIAPFLLAGFGILIMRGLIHDLVDEVWDTGDSLIVIDKGRRETIPLSKIVNVNYTTTNPRRVRLTLSNGDGELDEIVFSPVIKTQDYTRWLRNSVADDLIRRIHFTRHA
jgi:hypothetical protein